MIRKKKVLFVVLLLCLAGCAGPAGRVAEEQAKTEESQPEIVLTDTPVIPSATATVTATAAPLPTHTPSPVPTSSCDMRIGCPAFTPEGSAHTRCLKNLPMIPENEVLNGVAALGIFVPYQFAARPYLVDMDARLIIPLAEEGKHYYIFHDSVSSDGKYLASRFYFEEEGEAKLIIADSSGKIVRELLYDENWHGNEWLNDRELLIPFFYDEGDDPTYHSLILDHPDFLWMNPFTGERREILTEYPDMYHVVSTDHRNGATLSYNSTLTRVIFRQEQEDFSGYVLWDLEKQREIIKIHSEILCFLGPIWSPDGTRFVVNILEGDNLKTCIFNQNGELEQTMLYASGVSLFKYPRAFSWSPNNRKIAFWYASEKNEKEYLAVFDTEIGDISYLCLGENARMYIDFGNEAAWSQDSSKFLVEVWGEEDSDKVYLVDIEKHYAVKIAENAYVVGWMQPDRE